MSDHNDGKITRRAFAVGTIASGFALAVQPVTAATITTNAVGLIAGPVTIPVGDNGFIPGYMAQPERPGSFPIIVVVHEIFGVHEWIQDVCRRFAKLGYVAVAPLLFARYGDPAQMDSVQEIMEKIVAKVRDVDVMSDLDATVKYAGENGGDTEHIGITGFCWGGRIVWLYAAHTNPNATPKTALKAGVAWYGMLENSPFGQTQAIDVAAKIKVPVLGLYGAQDDSIPVKTIQDMRIALHNNSKDDLCQIRIYPEAGHGFFADYRPSYNTFAAQDGWGRTLAWFKKLMF